MNSEILEFHERLRILSKEAGGIRSLADKTNISERTIANWLSGKTDPKANALIPIAVEMGITLDWLVMGKGPMRLNEAVLNAPSGIDPERWNLAADKLVARLEEKGITPTPRRMVEGLALVYLQLQKIKEQEAQDQAADLVVKAIS